MKSLRGEWHMKIVFAMIVNFLSHCCISSFSHSHTFTWEARQSVRVSAVRRNLIKKSSIKLEISWHGAKLSKISSWNTAYHLSDSQHQPLGMFRHLSSNDISCKRERRGCVCVYCAYENNLKQDDNDVWAREREREEGERKRMGGKSRISGKSMIDFWHARV